MIKKLSRENVRLKEKVKEWVSQDRASTLLRPLDDQEKSIIAEVLRQKRKKGDHDEIAAQEGTLLIRRRNMRGLLQREWLNDEVINYFYFLLSKRDQDICARRPGSKRSHFFNSFFMTKMINMGNDQLEGEYCFENVESWSENIPGMYRNFFIIVYGSR